MKKYKREMSFDAVGAEVDCVRDHVSAYGR